MDPRRIAELRKEAQTALEQAEAQRKAAKKILEACDAYEQLGLSQKVEESGDGGTR